MKTIHYRIYQLPAQDDRCFRPLDYKTLDIKFYDCVHEGSQRVASDVVFGRPVCEILYALHNADDRVKAREIRSMSVSDIVVLYDGNNVPHCYYCNPYEFVSVDVTVPWTASDDFTDADTLAAWDENERGYAAAIGHGNILEIQAVTDAGKFDNDEEAVKAAAQDGIPLIPVNELPAGFEFQWLGFVDTPRNRRRIERYCIKHSKKA